MQRLEIKSTMTRVATVLLMLLTTATAWAQDAIDGLTYNTSGGYYEIKDAQDLIDLANYVKGGGDTYGKTFKQTANITFEHTSDWNDTSSGERNFEGIGDFFKGDYYGQGFTISGLRMSYGHGIFYCAYGAIIDGIVLADSRITNNENVGGIVGYTYENIEKDSKPAIVNNCHVRSDVLIHNASGAKAFKIGGVVGHNAKYCQVTNCTSSATITGRTAGGRRESIGGIVGENRGTVSNNFAFDVTIGNIDSYYGAIVGENTYLAILSNNYYFNCTVSGRTSNIGCNGADVTTDNGAYNLSPAHFEQTGTNEYTIHSAVGWEVFCDMLANSDKGYFTGKTVKLGNDIQISRAAGLDQHDFTGTFDGQGNTIKLAFGTSQNRYTDHAAVFRNTEWASSEQYAKIQNLNVNGTIYTASNVIYDAGLVAKAFGGLEISNCTSDVIINTSNQFAGGFVGYNQGKLDIVNCRSNATIYSTVNGDGTHGGFVGNHHSDELTIEGCVFTGKLLTTATNSTAYCGGFVGWCNTATTIKNCLYAPAIIDTEHGETEVQAGTGDYTSCTFSRKSTATVTITNSYYTRTLGTGQGKAARTITAGEYVTIEAVSPIGSPVEDGTYTVSGITAYAKGITRGDAFYYGNGDEVSLTLNHAEPPAGYTFTGYSASAGTLDGTTLTMPGDGDVTINANYEFIKFTQGALSYECTSGTEVKVTACNTSATSVTIPATVTDNNVTYTVTAIAADAFSGCTALTTVIMEPTTPPTLGNDAFANCNELANIYVPAGTSGAYKTAWADYASKIEDYGTCGTNVYWSYNSTSHKLTIFGTGAMADYSYSNRPWFSFRTDITTVDIRNGVTTIGEDAFDGCNALTNISIPTSVTSIGNYAFSNCYSLSSIELPTSLTSICKGTFNTCKSLTSITIPAGVTSIDDQAFEWCTALTSIDLPASVTSIGYYAFSLCTALSSIELPTSLTTICEKAFEACTSLTSITIPASVTRIDSYAFVKCSSLESISVAEGNTVYDSRNGCNAIIIKESNKLLLGCKNTVIPTGVTSIGKEAFYKCTGLTSITIPESVTSIGEEAFESCNSLTTVIMQPTTPPTLGNDVFENCDELANIYVPAGTTETYKTTGNWATYKDIIQTGGTCGTNVYWSYNSTSNTLTIFGTGDMTNDFEGNNWENYLNDITTVNISNGVTSIGDYAFSFCTGLTSIEIPASVKTIGNYAFQGCWGLTSIEIPASVTTIGNAAFNTCIYLTSINIPANVTTIGNEAFGNCTGLTSITIPASVTSIGYWAFINCIGLESISVASDNTIYDSRDNCNAIIEKATNTLIAGCKNTMIPNTVTSIGDYAFYSCEELKEITIPASVTRIANHAFEFCTSLTTVFMQPTTPPTLGNHVFDNCNDLANIYVPAGTSGVYKAAWADYASKIEDYGSCGENVNWSYNTDSHKLTIFGTGAMADYSYSNRPWYNYLNDITTVDIRAGVTTIGNEAFNSCTALTSIDIPASVTTIGNEAFYSCNALTSIDIPASVTSIGDAAFYKCTSLTSLNIPASVTSIATNAFYECTGLESISVADGNTVYDSRNGCNALIETASNTLIQGCKNTVIPNTVTTIGDRAFFLCRMLLSIDIPASVTSIGDEAFYGCVELEVWLLRDEYPITQLGADVFDECDDLIIYVPTDKVTDYKAAWSDYADKIKGFGEMEVLGLNDHVDNSTYIALCNGVTLDVNLCGLPVYKDGDWNTLCLPFDLTIEGSDLDGNNVLAMTLDKETSGLSGTTLTLNFTKATTIPAGTPFIIKWDNMHVIYQLSMFTGVTIDNTDRSVTSSDGYVTFKGTYAPIVWETENNSILFLGTKNTLYYPQPSDGNYPYINAFRAYFQLNNGLTAAEVSAARMNFEDDATGISDALRLNDKGQMTNDNFYDLQGRKIEKPTKGLYIHNGKKVIIK